MCGIVGIFRTQRAGGPIDRPLIEKMRDVMHYRGPDDAGLFISSQKEVGLGHRRLSIIDLSKGAAQPMTDEDESMWIVFNGEIYNHAALRQELEQKGVKFRTDHSDTEVLLKGYQHWGPDVLNRLRGMFAFAIWEKGRNKIFMARDRVGVKPLYFANISGMFIFASEIKALLEYPGIKRRLNNKAFYDHLSFVTSPPPDTLFEGISKLPAGHMMNVYADGETNTQRYWNPFTGVKNFPDRFEEEWIGKISASIRSSIQHRMVGDVKYGVFLSGGVDSSMNVAVMSKLTSRPVETFTIAYNEKHAANETQFARKVVQRYNANGHELIMNERQFIDFLPRLVFHQDEPISDAVSVPIYFLSKLAKENNTTVCQVGEGADELFCGYPHWGKHLSWQGRFGAYGMLPGFLKRMVSNMALSRAKSWDWTRRLDILRRASHDEPIFWGGAEGYPETTKRRFLSDAFLRKMGTYSSADVVKGLYKDFKSDAPHGTDELHWMSYIDLRLRLPEILLMRVDKMAMAASVEGRVPFLDQELIQLMMSIPQSMRFKNKIPKYLLKKMAESLLPHENIYRPKQGFAVPVEQWFVKHLQTWAHGQILDFSKRTGIFNSNIMSDFLAKSDGKMIWFLLNLVLWHTYWIEQREIQLPK